VLLLTAAEAAAKHQRPGGAGKVLDAIMAAGQRKWVVFAIAPTISIHIPSIRHHRCLPLFTAPTFG